MRRHPGRRARIVGTLVWGTVDDPRQSQSRTLRLRYGRVMGRRSLLISGRYRCRINPSTRAKAPDIRRALCRPASYRETERIYLEHYQWLLTIPPHPILGRSNWPMHAWEALHSDRNRPPILKYHPVYFRRPPPLAPVDVEPDLAPFRSRIRPAPLFRRFPDRPV